MRERCQRCGGNSGKAASRQSNGAKTLLCSVLPFFWCDDHYGRQVEYLLHRQELESEKALRAKVIALVCCVHRR